MSWMSKLYKTYEESLKLNIEGQIPIMPICHTLQNTHIKIIIDGAGNFKSAETLVKTQIVLPATEKSAGRSSGEAPHPLADKIQYVAKDYHEYGGKKKGYSAGYLNQLEKWCDSEFSHPKAIAVYNYTRKGALVRDLINHKVLFIDKEDNLLLSWPKDSDLDTPTIFKVLPKEKGKLDQGNALVCWSVEVESQPNNNTWDDVSLHKAWINYDLSNGLGEGLCYITGEQSQIAVNHPSKLRHSGDKAKLISANDMSGFTFKGRFTDSKKSIEKNGMQPIGIGFNVSQKAHNALRWLISRQGFRNGDQVIIVWAVSGNEIPSPMSSSYDMLNSENTFTPPQNKSENKNIIDHTIDLGESFANELKKHMSGYKSKLSKTDHIIVMSIDSATPGRMAITYYQELYPNDYFENISHWYEDFAWFQRIKVHDNESKKLKFSWLISSPSPLSITQAIFGKTISDSLKKHTMERLLPCIVDSRPLPKDLVLKAVRLASNRSAYKSDEWWLWEKNLGIACSLYRGYYKRNTNNTKEYKMALEENNNSRDYLFGRLLAIAEKLELIALNLNKEKRSTTAARLMQRFAERPSSTWRNIELALQPYIQRLKVKRGGFLHDIQKLLDDVMNKFKENDFINDKALSGEFLLAFHCQRLDLNKSNDEKNNTNNGEEE